MSSLFRVNSIWGNVDVINVSEICYMSIIFTEEYHRASLFILDLICHG